MHKITQDLKTFYDEQAIKFHNTRKKFRPELQYINKYIQKYPSTNIRVLELWCWDWRVLNYIKKNTDKKISYIWIDISNKLLQIAKNENPDQTFLCDDMINATYQLKSDHFDIIIAVASIQHLINRKQRNTMFMQCYRLLKYDGYFIQTNRTFSYRFIKKNRKQIAYSITQYLISWGKKDWNDIMIKRTNKNKQYWRFYHIFTKSELKSYIKKANFTNVKTAYINNSGGITQKRKDARDIFSVSKKSIIKL